ncbi:hypothetical protein PPL_11241 [Heterostelium album PN500]|uniref:Uncharacterized protein n=1 Tax=Heterostelium pallidum (strain ATCC 26659 / Pp 5 / PN500) TaxID=670386 RepID=D3BTY1_HETP5|nr:hypothetical protein PPL_11241 [Heterostelium album PN500]EFA75167.1 hypothetical protein PPL_11241 [Heterostelium album PN500]|eukprot:XP_020427301.1 hypothetical protein PPL_11241 [Heterostelium album PN500]
MIERNTISCKIRPEIRGTSKNQIFIRKKYPKKLYQSILTGIPFIAMALVGAISIRLHYKHKARIDKTIGDANAKYSYRGISFEYLINPVKGSGGFYESIQQHQQQQNQQQQQQHVIEMEQQDYYPQNDGILLSNIKPSGYQPLV